MKYCILVCIFLLSTVTYAQELRETFRDKFLIGTAVSNKLLESPISDSDLVCKHFNALTAENAMKWQNIQPEPGQYDFSKADNLIAIADYCDAEIIGHTLVWHQQTPNWVFEDENGKTLNREQLLQRLELHINTLVGRYKGKVKGWDVVNEALNEDGSLRDTKWRKIIGDDYFVKAFEFAHAADPDAELYYNDYNMYEPKKVAGAVRIVEQVKASGSPVTSVGMQGHYSVYYPTMSSVEDSIKTLIKAGVMISVTELDISVLPFPESGQVGAEVSQSIAYKQSLNPFADGMTEEMETRLTKTYTDLFSLYLKYQDKIDRVTLWGVDDSMSWRNNWPVPGRTDYPLLLDRNGQPKKAYHAVNALLK